MIPLLPHEINPTRKARLLSRGRFVTDGLDIPYLVFIAPSGRSIRLKFNPEGQLELRLPGGLKSVSIDDIFLKNRKWIESNWLRLNVNAAGGVSCVFLDEGWIYYLGRKVQLRLSQFLEPDTARLNGSMLELASSSHREHDIEDLVCRWLRTRAEHDFPLKIQTLARSMNLVCPRISVKDMRSRWGSCSTKGRINLNWKLILFPDNVIEYVMIHELAHLVHPDHSRRFWNHVVRYCPQVGNKRRFLNSNRSVLALKSLKKQNRPVQELSGS